MIGKHIEVIIDIIYLLYIHICNIHGLKINYGLIHVHKIMNELIYYYHICT